jgi:hypothetical protein
VQKYGEGRTIAMNQLFANGPGSIVETSGETFAFFILCIGFMISSLVVANKMGATGASATIALGQRLRRSGQRMATQPGRYIARNVVNKTGLAAERRFNQLQNSNPNSRLGKMVAKAARGTSMDEFVRGTTAKAKGAKFGLATTVSDNRKRNTEIQSRFTGAENARNAAYSLNELTNIREREKLDALNAKYAAGIAAGTPATNILTAEENSQRTALTAAYAGHTGLTAADLARKAELELKESEHRNNATGLSQAQLETLSDTERAAIAPYLSHSQVEKLGDSKELSDEQKQQLKDARTNTVKMLVESGIQDVTKLSIEQLEMMGENFIKDQAQKGNLKQSQVDDLKKSKKFTELQRDSFGKIHAAAQGAKALGKATSGAIPFSRLTNNELETIGKDALISSGAIYQLSKSQLDDLKKGKLSDDEKRDLDNARTQFITNTVTQSNAAGFDLLMQGKKADDVAELGINVLSHRLGIERLDINVLESMITKKRPPTDRDVLRAEIEGIATNPTMPPDPLQPHATILANFLNSPRGLRF